MGRDTGASIIEVRDLVKEYNGHRALDGISFEVVEGEIFGFLGPNGAGKTTTIRIMVGLLPPTSGDVLIAGFRPWQDYGKVKGMIGVVFENENLYERLSVRENLELFGKFYGVPKGRIDEVIAEMDLEGEERNKVRALSHGMRRRVMLARAIMHGPKILFLDEPTLGLDVPGAFAIRERIKRMKGMGVTVFLTTHYMEEAEQLCDRVAFINKGKIIAIGTPSSLIGNLPIKRTIHLELSDGSHANVDLDDPEAPDIVASLLKRGKVLRISTTSSSLEDVFMHLTGGEAL